MLPRSQPEIENKVGFWGMSYILSGHAAAITEARRRPCVEDPFPLTNEALVISVQRPLGTGNAARPRALGMSCVGSLGRDDTQDTAGSRSAFDVKLWGHCACRCVARNHPPACLAPGSRLTGRLRPGLLPLFLILQNVCGVSGLERLLGAPATRATISVNLSGLCQRNGLRKQYLHTGKYKDGVYTYVAPKP